MAGQLRPGTVLCTRSPGAGSWWIRFGAALRGKPNLQNHVAVYHHTDGAGTPWVLEGRPGGVGWRDARDYLASKWTITNTSQPIPDAKGESIAKWMEALIGTKYAWDAIVADALSDLGMQLPGWDSKWKDGEVAGQVVCSSAAVYAYAKASVPHPPGDKGCTPADWTQWIITRAWES